MISRDMTAAEQVLQWYLLDLHCSLDKWVSVHGNKPLSVT